MGWESRGHDPNWGCERFPVGLPVETERDWDKRWITFLVRGLLNKHSGLLTQARNHTIISFLKENLATVHKLSSTDKDPMSAYSHSDSRASLCFAVCLQLASSAH
ncbi:hypothetical protein BsWGS_20697 [Bradybaena similaris]